MHVAKNHIKIMYGVMIAISSYVQSTPVAPFFSIRSYSQNAARDLINWRTPYCPEVCTVHGHFGATFEFIRSFRPNKMARALFGDALLTTQDDATIRISGSRWANRGAQDLLADYFYLPTDYVSTVQIHPKIQTFLVNTYYRLHIDSWVPGLYVQAHVPLVHTRWDLKLQEKTLNKGVSAQDPGAFVPDAALTRNRLLPNASAFFNGQEIENIDDTIFQPLRKAKIADDGKKRTGAGDLYVAIGYDAIQNAEYGVGFSIEGILPTSNRPRGEFLWEPMTGNGHHWGFGGSVYGYYTAWNGEYENSWLSLIADIHVHHLFTCEQERTFDLKGRPLSRYMLAQALGVANTDEALQAGTTLSSFQFQREFAPLANITTLPVDVSIGVQADFVAMAAFNYDHINVNAGVNVWVRSCEHISLDRVNSLATNVTWALKGDAQVFGFRADSTTAIALAATQSSATINRGNNFPATGAVTSAQIVAGQKNPGIDTPMPAFQRQDDETFFILQYAPSLVGTFNNQISTSGTPIFLSDRDLDIEGAETRAGSCKLFADIHYNWTEYADSWTPSIGIGGEIEWGFAKQHDSCINTPLSQWGVWVDLRLSY